MTTLIDNSEVKGLCCEQEWLLLLKFQLTLHFSWRSIKLSLAWNIRFKNMIVIMDVLLSYVTLNAQHWQKSTTLTYKRWPDLMLVSATLTCDYGLLEFSFYLEFHFSKNAYSSVSRLYIATNNFAVLKLSG